MRPVFSVSEDVKARQRKAADPALSVWVSANAGAGKTKVLTDRVIRLLLDGTAPSRILCLTFTKAAAAEMTIRVFETLGDWVTLDDPGLRDALRELTGAGPSRAEIAAARRLFARAVETPGGLKIETIHAFCERLLHLMPFEADVPAGFEVLDEQQAAELLAEAQAAILAEAAAGQAGDEALAVALDAVAALASGPRFPALLAAAIAHPALPEGSAGLADAEASLRAAFELAPDETSDRVRRRMLEEGLPPSEWAAVAAEIRAQGKKSDLARAASLDLASRSVNEAGRLAHYLSVFLTDEDTPRKNIVTASVTAPLRGRLADEQVRLVELRPTLLAAEALERSLALFVLAGAVRRKVSDLKARLGALDFDDLIGATLALLEESDVAAWVHYRLDQGIDHVLVDEAQDTNPHQWRILRLLTEEFTAGAGRPLRAPRTIFVVGDPKQSIYSFQGADPSEFAASRNHWRARHREAGRELEDVRLDLSFRSVARVLNTVDATFSLEASHRGLGFDDPAIGTSHVAARQGEPGEVEIWETETPSPSTEPDAWALPLDLPKPGSPAVTAAERVARAVAAWTRPGADPGSRHRRPGDILILARKRGAAFFAVIRALKAAGIPVAGADRIEIGQQIAVADLVAAGGAALLPENDLVLAAALKSPLVGLDDDDLIRIAADRPDGQPLAAALAAAGAAGDTRAAGAAATLAGWRELARNAGPFGFFATLLGPGGGRRQLVERLGGEAADAIDVFLARAESDEFGPETTSLTAFLSRFEAAEHVVRRDPEAAGDQVRVMTVHGAKGLEAPLVVLLDGCEVGGPDPALIPVPVGRDEATIPVWGLASATDPPALAEARAALRGRALEEHNRLLYVALTRARDRLVIVPFTDGRGQKPSPEAWGQMVLAGLAAQGLAPERVERSYGPVDLWADPARPAPDPAGEAPARPPGLPDWLTRPVDPEREPAPPLRPSGPLGAADRADEGLARDSEVRAAARRRGMLLHGLLAHGGALRDAADPARDAATFLAREAGDFPDADRDALAADALAVIRHADLAELFGPGSRGEVALAGRVRTSDGERPVAGRVDRLAITPAGTIVADFKTGRPPANGAAPEADLAQLAIYRELLSGLDPGRPVRALLVWTSGPLVIEPDAADLAAARERVLARLP